MKITVRTVSDLPTILQSEVADTSLMQMSVRDDSQSSGYISKKLPYSMLATRIKDDVSSYNEETYNLAAGMDVGACIDKLNDTLSSSAEFTGSVSFTETPTIDGTDIATTNDVSEMIGEATGSFITKNTEILQEVTLTATVSQGKEDDHCIEISKKGFLSIYGSMSDTGYVAPAEAWVAIKGKINGDSTWKILQVQPWIVGDKSSQLQYVSFMIPVCAGLKVTVESGFSLSEINSGAQNTNRSLIVNGEPNVFLGYVLGE